MSKPWLDDGDLRLYHGDALTVLQGLPAGIAQTCVTSPPYWGLRDYGTGQWTGGDEACDHKKAAVKDRGEDFRQRGEQRGYAPGSNFANYGDRNATASDFEAVCGKCGAQRVDSQLGLEATPTLYVENMVRLFREVWRVLRDDGTLWLNLGDSYAGGGGGNYGNPIAPDHGQHLTNVRNRPEWLEATSLKPKDLVGIPWQVAFALQADGWYLRSDIIWSKPNPMPESVTDRPTKSHEYLFLFSKQPRYFYDADAIREENSDGSIARFGIEPGVGSTRAWNTTDNKRDGRTDGTKSAAPFRDHVPSGRNRRSVWTIPTQPFPQAHFATYPEELVRPCILAGTSEKGECVECGKPWHRTTGPGQLDMDRPQARRAMELYRQSDLTIAHIEAIRSVGIADTGKALVTTNGAGHNTDEAQALAAEAQKVLGGYYREFLLARPTTTGWEPSCLHDAPPRPQLVLDPFIGSGTTSLVARKHGRRSLGIDLSAEYLAIAAQRTQQLSLLGTQW